MKLLLYCTKAKPYLFKNPTDVINQFIKDYWCADKLDEKPFDEDILNGKIVAECDFKVEDLRIVDDDPLGAYWYETKTLSENEVLEKSCLTGDELFDYLGEDNEGYAIHIKNLHIFDKPKELSEYFSKPKKMNTLDGYSWVCESIDRAPQNMMYAYDGEGNKYIVISIQSQWMCEILNGEKTIEVRKKVLKEMLE